MKLSAKEGWLAIKYYSSYRHHRPYNSHGVGSAYHCWRLFDTALADRWSWSMEDIMGGRLE